MRFHVFGKMVRAHKSLAAHRTRKTFLTRVCTKMSLEFIRTGEAFPAEEPVAHVGALTSVPSKMRLKMRGFAVHFITTGVMTDVSFLCRRLSGTVFFTDTIRTLTLYTPTAFDETCREFRD